jgi:hypothetical protein
VWSVSEAHDEEVSVIDKITPTQFRKSDGLGDWRVLGDGANAYFRTGSFAKGARLLQAISELCYERAQARMGRRSPPAAGWCATSSHRDGGRWPTRRATRSTSPR